MQRSARSSALPRLGLVLLLVAVARCRNEAVSAPSPTFDATPTSLEAKLPEAALAGEDKADAYLCTSVQLPADTLHVTAFEAAVTSDAVTNMMLYGCKSPAEDQPVWSCYMRSPCGVGREAILSGWSADAPPVVLPKGVSFSVGAGTGIATVVLQVHYSKGRPAGDTPGFRLALSPRPTPNAAGMLTYASRFAVPPGKPSHRVTSSCCYAGFEPLHALGYRVHTHELGRSVWMERKTPKGHARIAEGDPRRGQGFVPFEDSKLTLLPGDKLSTTCDFDSTTRTEDTEAGPDTNQEMCNMFMMVYSETPYFMVCGNDQVHVRPEGPGGIPEGAALTRDGSGLWKPPPPMGRGQNDGSVVGQISGVAKGAGDTIWVLHRGGKPWDAATFFSGGRAEHITDPSPVRGPVVLQLKQHTGEVLRSWGDGQLVMPHGLAVDARGEAIWVTDVGRHQAIKYSMDGEELLKIGLRGKPGHDIKHLCKPTAVAVSNDGDVFIADGYCNSRVLHFSSTGKFIQSIALPKGKLQVPHSIAIDTCANALYVADRGASSIRRFQVAGDFAGELSRSWDLSAFGPVQAVTPGPYGSLLAVTWDKASQSAMVIHLDTTDGADLGSGVLDTWELDGVHTPHDIALSAAPLTATLGGSRTLAVYVAETARGRASHLHKFIIHHPSVEVMQLQHTQLADVDLPELEVEAGQGLGSSANAVRRPGTGADVAAAESALAAEQTSRAAEDIERAAKTIEKAAAALERVASDEALSNAQRNAALLAAHAASLGLGPDAGDATSKAIAAAAVSKAAAGVGKVLGLKAAPKSHGPGHYIMVVLAPLGALAVFAVLAIALTQKMGAWPPNGAMGFTALPTRDDFHGGNGNLASPNSSSGGKSDKQEDPAEVVVSSQMDTMNSKSVRRPSALGASELRRMAAQAAQFSAPSPLGQDDGLRTRSTDFGPGSVRARSGGGDSSPPLAPTPVGTRRGSIRRASASTASAVSVDTMRRLMQAGPLARTLSGSSAGSDDGTQGPAGQNLGSSPLQTQMNGSSHSRNNSGESLADIYSRSAAAAGLGTSTGSLQASAQQPLPVQSVQRVLSGEQRAGVARSSWSGSLTAISEIMGGQTLRDLAAGTDGRRGLTESGAPTARRMSPLQKKTESQQD